MLYAEHSSESFAGSRGTNFLEYANVLEKTYKGTIRIPYDKIDAELIERIAKWCFETGNHV